MRLNVLSELEVEIVLVLRMLVGVRVLIVEDDQALATTIERGLSAEGFDCEVVHDGAEALWNVSSATYAAIVLDLLLPSKNGFTICRELREAHDWTPVLILTAKHGEYDLAEALDCGADDFMSKPFSFVVLTARLRALIRRGHVPRPAVLEVGALLLDPFARRCWVGAEELPLTPRESAVLACLIRAHPAVVSKDELLDEVWGTDQHGGANIVDVYIGHLRRKLRPYAEHASIVNVRGHGFRLAAHA